LDQDLQWAWIFRSCIHNRDAFSSDGIAGIVVLSVLCFAFLFFRRLFLKIASRYIKWSKPPEPRPSFWKKWTHFVVEHPLLCLGVFDCYDPDLNPMREIETAQLDSDFFLQLNRKKGIHLARRLWSRWLMPAIIVMKNCGNVRTGIFKEGEKSFRKCGDWKIL